MVRLFAERAGASRRAMSGVYAITGPRFRKRSAATPRSCLRSSASSWQEALVPPTGGPRRRPSTWLAQARGRTSSRLTTPRETPL